MIDYVLISKRWKSSIMDTVSLPGADFDSDHSLLMSKLKLRLKRLPKTTRIPRFRTELLRDPIKKGAYTTRLSSKFRAILENFTSLTTFEEIDQLAEHATSAVLETANDILGRKTKDENPWIIEEIIQLCNQKRFCNNKADPCSRDTYKYLKRRIEQEVQKALRNHVTGKCKECETQFRNGNSQKPFKTVRELSSRKDPISTAILDKQNNPLNDAKMKLERWKEYFEDKLNPQIIADPSILNSFPINDREPPPPLLKSETEAAIRSLKRGKAPGPDGITAELINIDSEDIVELYHKVLSPAWSTGHVPQLWCKAAVVPIQKKAQEESVRTTALSA